MPSACFKRRRWWRFSGKILGNRNKKHKKQPFSDASASHLSLVLWSVWFQAGAWISHSTPLTPPSYEVGGIAKRIKPLAFGEKPNPVGTWYFTSVYNCNIVLNINHLARTRSIASLPCKIVLESWYNLFSRNHFIIRGFSPWNGEWFLSLGQSG